MRAVKILLIVALISGLGMAAYLLLSLLMLSGLWLFGQVVFTRKRRIGAGAGK